MDLDIRPSLDIFGDHTSVPIAFQNNAKIHIRLQIRNKKKCITILEGLDDDLDEKRICRHMRKSFNCNGAVLEDKDTDSLIIQFQGDQRQNIKDWLIAQEILTEKEAKERLVIHGA